VGKNILKLSIIGAGAMGSAIASGIYLAQEKSLFTSADTKAPEQCEINLSICNRSQEKLNELNTKIDFTAYQEIEEMINAEKPDLLIIAVKPKDISNILDSLKNINTDCVIISVLAGISIKSIEDKFPSNPVFRAMPNTPTKIGSGITALTHNKHCNDKHKLLAQGIFNAVGDVISIDDENKMHAVTAISGSGPAYFFFLVEALIKAGIQQGLSIEEASILVNKTFLGSGLLLEASTNEVLGKLINSEPWKPNAEILREAVTSPNGTTHAAISSLENNEFLEIINQAIQAASKRSQELTSS
jgi:pyrroline-5-carboxylate reductase